MEHNSPLLKIGIAMGYVKTDYSEAGATIQVNIRGKIVKGQIVEMPFYDVSKYGWRRKHR